MRVEKCRSAFRIRGGFTLLEVIIAVGILATAFVVLLQAHVMNLKMIHRSQIRTRAMLLAEKKVAEIEGKVPMGSGGVFSESPGFSWEKNVSSVRIGDKALSGLLRVEVIVSWAGGGQEEKVKLVTYLAER